MEFFPPNKTFDFMKYRPFFVGLSTLLCALSLIGLFYPGPNLGTDFAGGTELELHFTGTVRAAELRTALERNYTGVDVVEVQGHANRYIVRVRETSRLPRELGGSVDAVKRTLTTQLRQTFGQNEVIAVDVSPGGDKVSIRFASAPDLARLSSTLEGQHLRVRNEPRQFGPESDHRYEVDLIGVADQMLEELGTSFVGKAPSTAERIEWVGPRAGAQLRDSAIKALLYTLLFIMVYVSFRFDLRFAPGGIIALIHDALITAGMFVLVRKEFNLTTIASLLTIIGYSINDTIVIFDRIRENMARHKNMTLGELINISTSQTLSRTIITSGVTLLSVLFFFFFGTQVIQDIAFALTVGFIVGSYSSIYIAAPVTEWIDRNLFSRANLGTGRTAIAGTSVTGRAA